MKFNMVSNVSYYVNMRNKSQDALQFIKESN
jgi:hypothetical protein